MSNVYLASDTIKVYPTALRGGTDYTPGQTVYDPESRLGTEFNLTSAVNRLTLDGSFVIRKTGNVLEFSIHGYYFKVTSVSTLTNHQQLSSGTSIYATIRLEELAQQNYRLLSLVSVEDGTSINLDTQADGFVGVAFTNTDEGDNVSTFSLEILRKVSGSWVVPDTSLLRFDAEDVMIDETKSNSATSLHDVIYKDTNNDIHIVGDQFKGHFDGTKEGVSNYYGFVGDVDGNSKTATDSEYSSKIGTSTNHPAIGSNIVPVYVNSNGVIVRSSGTTIGSYNQPVYFNNGTITAAFKVHVDNVSPNTTTGYNEGDLWIQYLG